MFQWMKWWHCVCVGFFKCSLDSTRSLGTTWGLPHSAKTRLSSPHCGDLLIYSTGSCVTLHHIWLPLRWASALIKQRSLVWCESSQPDKMRTFQVTYVQLTGHSTDVTKWRISAVIRRAGWCGACYETGPSTTIAKDWDSPNTGDTITSNYTARTRFSDVASHQVYRCTRACVTQVVQERKNK